MTEHEAPPDWGFDYGQDDPYDDGSAVQTTSSWTANGQLLAPTETVPAPLPWYLTKPAAVALIVAASAAVAAPIVLLTSRTGPAPGPAQPTSVLPQAATSAAPIPGSAGTPMTILAPPPPPPPPAPSPAEDTATARSPRWSTHEPTQKPTTAAPTPITRAPISVAPVPRQPSETNSATPGVGHRHWW